jgi:hypothetical protein
MWLLMAMNPNLRMLRVATTIPLLAVLLLDHPNHHFQCGRGVSMEMTLTILMIMMVVRLFAGILTLPQIRLQKSFGLSI